LQSARAALEDLRREIDDSQSSPIDQDTLRELFLQIDSLAAAALKSNLDVSTIDRVVAVRDKAIEIIKTVSIN